MTIGNWRCAWPRLEATAHESRHVLIREYPRQIPNGDQVDLVEVMEIADRSIQHHRMYCRWKACTLIAPALARLRSQGDAASRSEDYGVDIVLNIIGRGPPPEKRTAKSGRGRSYPEVAASVRIGSFF